MHEKTYYLLLVIKVCEFVFQLILFALMQAGCQQLIRKLDGECIYISILSVGALVIALYHIVYNNLITNLRYRFRSKCCCQDVTTFECLNYVMCYCWLRRICSDKPSMFYAIKWSLKLVYFGVLVGLIKWQEWLNPEIDLVDEDKTENFRFDDLLIIYIF